MSVIVRQGTYYLLPVLLLFSLFLLLRGHNAPGGGFVGGLVAASAFALHAVAWGVPVSQKVLRISTGRLIATGLLVAMLSGLLGVILGTPFLSGMWWAQAIPVMGKLGTPFVFDVGVYLLVCGVALTILFALMEQ